jgi:hypothetical protein
MRSRRSAPIWQRIMLALSVLSRRFTDRVTFDVSGVTHRAFIAA